MAFLAPPPPFPFFPSSNPPPQPPSHLPIPLRKRALFPVALSLPTVNLPKAYLSRIDLVDNNKLPQSVVDQNFQHLLHKRVSREEVDAAVTKTNIWFTQHRYPASRLAVVHYPGYIDRTLVLYSIEPKLAALRLILVDKDGKPLAEGEPVTRKSTVLRVLGVEIGKVFEWKPEGFGTLMALGVFEYADAEVDLITNQMVELTLKVRERPSCRLEPGAGMTSDGRFYGDVSIVDSNFLGRAQRLQVEWQKHVDVGRFSGGLVFEDMRLGARIPLSFKFRAYRDSNSARQIPTGRASRPVSIFAPEPGPSRPPPQRSVDPSLGYEKDRDGMVMEIGFRPGRKKLMLAVAPMLEYVRPNVGARQIGDRIMQTVLQMSALHVTRLPIDTPRAGHFASVEHSVGRPILGDVSHYFRKTTVRLAQYMGIGSKASIAMSASLGFGSDNLPWHEQKSLGGLSNVRGYRYGELGRYKSYGVGRMELRVPLTRSQKETESGEEESEVDKAEGPEKAKVQGEPASDKSGGEDRGNLYSSKMEDNMPSLVGVLFGDLAMSTDEAREPIGASYGLGLRVGGVISVEWTRKGEGGQSQIHFGLIDRSF